MIIAHAKCSQKILWYDVYNEVFYPFGAILSATLQHTFHKYEIRRFAPAPLIFLPVVVLRLLCLSVEKYWRWGGSNWNQLRTHFLLSLLLFCPMVALCWRKTLNRRRYLCDNDIVCNCFDIILSNVTSAGPGGNNCIMNAVKMDWQRSDIQDTRGS